MGKRLLLASLVAVAFAAGAAPLEQGFVEPPDEARPWVYWFWLNGNITRDGITADLEAMQRAGIGGVLIMEVDQGIPGGPVAFMGPEWRDLFRHVVSEAQRLGLEVNMNNDAGWNGSGGPWITPEQSMQKVVWSETPVEGPQRFEGTLPQPEAIAGHYRDIAVQAVPATATHRIDNIESKAGYRVGGVAPAAETELPAGQAIAPDGVIDLTDKMTADGRLAWDAPPGQWVVLRFGHTSTGIENAPAPPSGRGLECDKLAREGIEANFAGMMGKLIEDNRPAAGGALAATHIDSWENGAQNWTPRMREEFRQRRGYDPLPYLPVVTGRVLGTVETSERFLWDLRRTVSDLIVANYAGRLSELAHAHGLRLSIEAYGGPCDNLSYAGRADEPMCEFWIGGNGFSTCKEQASAAHTYGRPILGAEAFTANDTERWLEHPGSMKALGDRAFCDGVNRFVFHRYALQPWADRRPGMTMGPWGVHYERTQTWWAMTPAWHEYLARCQFMLRQGLFVADICYLEAEASPQGYGGRDRKGYDFDDCSAEVVMTRMAVRDGRVTLPDGMSYRVLALPAERFMTPALLEKVAELVRAGATVVGPPPRKSPSLEGFPDCDARVQALAAEVWGDCDGQSVKEHRFGAGRVVWGKTPEEVLAESGVGPDFSSRFRLGSIHRATADADVYFVANPHAYEVRDACAFRMTGRAPQLWHPETGQIEPAAAYMDENGATRVWLELAPSESVFVVFPKVAEAGDPVVAVARDGTPLLSVRDSGPRITITGAAYGILGESQWTRNVTEKVQRLVDMRQYLVPVVQMAEGDDPAPDKVKSLTVSYEIGGRKFSVTGKDGDTVRLTDEAAGIRVEKATYGVPGDLARTRNVRTKLQRIVDTGETTFQVARLAEGDDPAFGIVKTLTVEYSVDGRRRTATGTDMDILCLAPPPEPAERTAAVRGGGIEAWQPGVYEWTTASGRTGRAEVRGLPEAVEIAGPWEVTFEPKLGAPDRATFDALVSWSEHGDPGIKYFSGAATYRKAVAIPEERLAKGRRLYLDLGEVQVMARVKLNGRDLGVLWKPPYCVDITGAARPGDNALEVDVANLWVNRLIGDEQLPEDSKRNPEGTLAEWPEWVSAGQPSPTGRIAFTTWRLWAKDAPLQRSGLCGPVTLVSTATVGW